MDVINFRVEQVRLETPVCYTYFLREVTGKSIAYKAGQFLTLLLTINGREVRRSYSLSSAPLVDANLSITVKRVPNGEASRYIIDNIKEGDVIQALLPAGRFTINQPNEKLFCFIAAGSGISPIYALIKSLLNKPSEQKLLLIYQSRKEDTAIFRKQLLLLQEGYRNRFTIIELFSQPGSHSIPPRRLNNFLLEQIIRQHVHTTSVQFYICGPALFMKMGEFTLKTLGYESSKIFKENFVIDTPAPPALMIDSKPRKVSIHYKHDEFDVQVKYPESILQAALRQHVHLPYSCRGGRCSTCTVRLLSGKVKMSINDVLTEKDIADGLVLTCVGYAETDVLLRVE